MGCLGLQKGLSKEENLELGFELGSERRFRRLTGSEFQTNGAIKLKEHSPKNVKLHSGIFRSFLFEDWNMCLAGNLNEADVAIASDTAYICL